MSDSTIIYYQKPNIKVFGTRSTSNKVTKIENKYDNYKEQPSVTRSVVSKSNRKKMKVRRATNLTPIVKQKERCLSCYQEECDPICCPGLKKKPAQFVLTQSLAQPLQCPLPCLDLIASNSQGPPIGNGEDGPTGPTGPGLELTFEVTDGLSGAVLSSATVGPTGRVVFYSDTMDIIVAQGSALVNIENPSNTLDAVYQNGEIVGNIVNMNISDGPIILRDDESPQIGSILIVDNGTDRYLDINSSYLAGSGAITPTGVNGIVIGSGADIGSADNAIALGTGAGATGDSSIAIGAGTNATSLRSIAIGENAQSSKGIDAIAIGSGSSIANAPNSMGLCSIAMGCSSMATNFGNIAIGYFATASENVSVAFGNVTESSGGNSVAVGNGVISTATNSVAMGVGALATGISSVALGNGALSAGEGSISIGCDVDSAERAQALGTNSIAIGEGALSSGFSSIAIGDGVGATGDSSLAFGKESLALSANAIVIGRSNVVTGVNSVVLSPTTSLTTNEASNSIILSTLDTPLTLSSGVENDNILTKVFSVGERWATNVSGGAIDYTRPNRLVWGANEVKTTSGNVIDDPFTTELEIPINTAVLIIAKLIGVNISGTNGDRWSYTYHTDVINVNGSIDISDIKNITAVEIAGKKLNDSEPLSFIQGSGSPATSIQFAITTTNLSDSPPDVIQWILVVEAIYNRFV